MDKKKEFLNKVYNTIVKETIIDKKNNIISFPWYNIRLDYLKIIFEGPTIWRNKEPYSIYDPFLNHCVNIYGLTDWETYSLWYNYKNFLRDIIENVEYLNENVDKQKNFLDKVLERLFKDTVITDSKITFPFAIFKQEELTGDSLLSVSIWMDGRWENHKYPQRFEKYVNDIYGITYEESIILWNSYMDIIEKEVLKRLRKNDFNVATTWGMSRHDINESGDKQKEYLEKVLENLKSETKFKVVKNDANVGHKYDYYWKYPFSEFTTLTPYYPTTQNSNFHKHCRNVYGLSNEEIENYILPNYYDWLKYNNPIFRFSNPEMLFKNTTINENRDIQFRDMFIKNFIRNLKNEKQKEYLDKVVEQLLRETEIDYEKRRINYPFFENTTYSFQYTLPYSGPFIRYCKNIFPLSKNEMRYVYEMYVGFLNSKIRKYYVDNDIYNKYYNVMGTKTLNGLY